MTAGGCIPMARELRREAPEMAGPSPLAADLAMWRAGRAGGEHHLDEGCALLLFGVGLATLERIERGEVDPEPELAERIARYIYAPHSPAAARPAGVSPAPTDAGCDGGAAVSPLLAAAPLAAEGFGPPIRIPPPSPALAKGDDDAFHVEIFLGGQILLEMEIGEAEQLGGELLALAALAREPDLYDTQNRLARAQRAET